MALKDKLEEVQAQAQAKAVQNSTPSASKSTDKDKKIAAMKAQGASIRAQMSEDQKAVEGSKSDKVSYVCALGNPNVKTSRKQGNQNLPSYTVVGYKFKVLEDMTVPFAPLRENMTTLLDVEPATERAVKAGEIVALNTVEAAMFISRIEFAGSFTGEGTNVTMSARTSKDRPDPLPILTTKTGSVKENMELIADMVGITEANPKGTPQIKPEYEASWGALFRKKNAGPKSTGGRSNKNDDSQNLAAAFRAYYANK